MPDRQKEKSSGGLSLQTLLISAVAAAAAATIVPLFWEHGTILATAMTPVIVALVSEGLRKPVQHVSAVAPRVARRSGTGAALRRYEPSAAETRHPERVGARGQGPERFDPLPPDERGQAPALSGDDPFGLRQADRRPRLKIALVTGLLAFLIAAAVVTASELAVFGSSVSSNQRTSLFGGSTKKSSAKKSEATPTPTPSAQATGTPTPTPSAQATPTPSPAVNLTPSPVPTATPGAATPAPTP
jgi:hypothetical protein